MILLNWGAMPAVDAIEPRWQRIIYKLFRNPANFIKTFVDLMLGYAYQKLNLVNRFDIVFTAGSALTTVDQYAKKIVPFNLCDYDHYCRVNLTNERVVKGKYAVFLDINLPYQSDLVISGLPAVNASCYFKSLNHFLDLLEDAYGVKVVIAAHPKAAYINNEYNQREIYSLLTAELVKDAEFVITHTSTALSYAVLNSKPLVFIYTDEMMSIYKNTFMREIESSANYLNASIYNIDEITDGSQVIIKLPNQELYESYKYNYLTSQESENKISAEIFWSEINSL
jgi:hypothetical protein